MHYKLTTETKTRFGITLHRIEALVDMPWHGVRTGDKGGWVQSTQNLQKKAWVSGNAWVYGDARVYGNAQVYGKAKLSKPSDIRCISGFTFYITRTKGYAVIGCKRLSIKQWLAMPLSEAEGLGLPKEEYESIRTILQATRIRSSK